MAKGGRFLTKKPVKPRRRGKWLLIVILILLLLIGGAIAAGAVYYNSMLNLITRPETVATEHSMSDEEFEAILGYVPEKMETTETTVETTQAPTEPKEDHIVNIMLIGQNYRKGEEHKLSDTLILCSLNKETKTLTLTSFLRDLYLQLPNYKGHICGKNRINVAYNLGWYWENELAGMEMLDMVIQNNFGVEVDYNVEVGFEAFKQIIDSLGGVDMELTADEAWYITMDAEVNGSYSAGMTHLNGEAALSYARIRHANAGDNDFNRTNRQRKLIIEILNQCRSKSLGELNNMLQEMLPLIITDMTNKEITDLALELLPMLKDLKIVSNQCPAPDTYTMGMVEIGGMDASVIHCDLEKNGALLQEIAEMPES